MEEDMYYGDGLSDIGDLGDIDEDLLRAYLDGDEVSPEIEELLKAYGQEAPEALSRVTVKELWENCLSPTFFQTVENLLPLFLLCFVFKLICSFSKSGSDDQDIPPWLIHLSSLMFGLLALHMFFQRNLFYLLLCSILAFAVLVITNWRNRDYCGLSLSVFIIVYLVACEFLMDKTVWHSIRGAQIILSMKIIGLAFDLSTGAMIEFPSVFAFFGYNFCVGTVIFGPWISFSEYKHILSQHKRPMKVFWVLKVLFSLICALLCVVCSTCLVHWLILDTNFKWIVAYRDAQSFRFSHYFVSFLSEVTVILCGLGATHLNDDVRWDLRVSKPYHIEVPRSLVEVVTNWNIPMHTWLKNYVFKSARPLGNFAAIFLTYVASALLHGLNFQLAAVLLSLGVYTYVEYVFRNKLSVIFDACIKARRCKEGCGHAYKYSHPYVITANLLFGSVAVFHLAYLGLMFDHSSSEESGYSMEHTLSKWSSLNYLSHWVILGTFLFHVII
ncbi:protein-serine O-palmitoleoyltransferase porcupine-like [Ruditapes philippinarum]|uniref:protein-serine O-palmitoleoyltransferase porcupine-like n=1 Tax=Ruditapes philippinarum TaxID=129788 RepID=UPI00295B8921|nr:protein-serine O-palmitoleoyltransferase porcupine-like [Ruditapes philippinarum]